MATRLAHPGSQAMNRMSTQPTPMSARRARPLSLQFAFKSEQHTEGEGSAQFADEGKDLAV